MSYANRVMSNKFEKMAVQEKTAQLDPKNAAGRAISGYHGIIIATRYKVTTK